MSKKGIFLSFLAILFLAGYFFLIAIPGFLYPMTGDDFVLTVAAEARTIPETVRYYFYHWGIRTGTLLVFLLAKLGEKSTFDLFNPLVQLALLFLAWLLAARKRFDLRSAVDCSSLLFLGLLLLYAGGRPRDTIYWMTGAVTYSWTMVLLLAFFAVYWYYLLPREFSRRTAAWLPVPLLLLGLLAGMSNENNAGGGLLVLIAIAVLVRYTRRRPGVWFYSGITGFLAGIALLLGAPGLRVRYMAEMGDAASLTLFDRLKMLPEIVAFWSFSSLPCLLAAGIFLAVWCWRERELLPVRQWPQLWRNNRPVIAALALILLSLLMGLAFCAGRPPAIRAYFSCFVLNGIAATVLFRSIGAKYRLAKFNAWLLLSLALFLLLLIVPAFRDAAQINREEKHRQELIAEQLAAGQRDLIVPVHTVQRRSLLHYLFVEDIQADPDFWLNQAAAAYYRANSIRTAEEIEVKTFWRQ